MTGSPIRDFIGERARAWQVGEFTFARWAAHVWGDAVQPHGHDRAHFMLVIGGRYRSAVGCNADDALPLMIYNPPGTWHCDRFEEPGRFFSIELASVKVGDSREFALPSQPVRVAGPNALALVQRIRREAAGHRDSPEQIEALTIELLGEISPDGTHERRPPPWLTLVAEALRDVPVKGSIASLSRLAGVHPVHLTRTFRAFYGCTPAEYALRLRLAHAARLLGETRRALADVAIDAGFADQSHFTTRFRAVYGLPPGEYRRRLG